MRNYLTKGIMIGGITVLMYFLARAYSLYYIFWWYDSVQHFIGGISLGFLGMVIFKKHYQILSGTLIVAILWEIAERVGSFFVPEWLGYGGSLDTLLDIGIALIGTWIVITVITRKKESL